MGYGSTLSNPSSSSVKNRVGRAIAVNVYCPEARQVDGDLRLHRAGCLRTLRFVHRSGSWQPVVDDSVWPAGRRAGPLSGMARTVLNAADNEQRQRVALKATDTFPDAYP